MLRLHRRTARPTRRPCPIPNPERRHPVGALTSPDPSDEPAPPRPPSCPHRFPSGADTSAIRVRRPDHQSLPPARPAPGRRPLIENPSGYGYLVARDPLPRPAVRRMPLQTGLWFGEPESCGCGQDSRHRSRRTAEVQVRVPGAASQSPRRTGWRPQSGTEWRRRQPVPVGDDDAADGTRLPVRTALERRIATAMLSSAEAVRNDPSEGSAAHTHQLTDKLQGSGNERPVGTLGPADTSPTRSRSRLGDAPDGECTAAIPRKEDTARRMIRHVHRYEEMARAEGAGRDPGRPSPERSGVHHDRTRCAHDHHGQPRNRPCHRDSS